MVRIGHETSAKEVYKDIFEYQNLLKERERFMKEIFDINTRINYLKKKIDGVK
jgi:uncharacterized protein YeeX (DUF496 family)